MVPLQFADYNGEQPFQKLLRWHNLYHYSVCNGIQRTIQSAGNCVKPSSQQLKSRPGFFFAFHADVKPCSWHNNEVISVIPVGFSRFVLQTGFPTPLLKKILPPCNAYEQHIVSFINKLWLMFVSVCLDSWVVPFQPKVLSSSFRSSSSDFWQWNACQGRWFLVENPHQLLVHLLNLINHVCDNH